MQKNQISGNILSILSDWSSLDTLIADENNLPGFVPDNIGNLRNMGLLSLRHNDFWGSIPSSVGNMTNLIQLDLSHNKLQGKMPPSVGNFKILPLLYLSNNNLMWFHTTTNFWIFPFIIGSWFIQKLFIWIHAHRSSKFEKYGILEPLWKQIIRSDSWRS